jgi:DNA-binding transcriptional regulator YdaS (Cro superfamily)
MRSIAAGVYKWLHNKAKVSPEHVNSIVKATGGEIQAYQIRPDLPTLFPSPIDNNAA